MEVKILIVNESKDFHSKLSCERMCIDFAVQLKVSEIFVSSKNSAMKIRSACSPPPTNLVKNLPV
jgi:hypothetical protein